MRLFLNNGSLQHTNNCGCLLVYCSTVHRIGGWSVVSMFFDETRISTLLAVNVSSPAVKGNAGIFIAVTQNMRGAMKESITVVFSLVYALYWFLRELSSYVLPCTLLKLHPLSLPFEPVPG